MTHRIRMAVVGLLLLTLFTPALSVSADHGLPFGNQHFEDTWARTDRPVHDLDTARTWMWGPGPNSGSMNEPYLESPGGEREVQYFDKSRMELNLTGVEPDSIWYVTNGLLVIELITGRMQVGDDSFEQHNPSLGNVAGDHDGTTGPTYAALNHLRPEVGNRGSEVIVETIDRDGNVDSDPALGAQGITTAHYDGVTGHNIAAPFWDFMNSGGTIYEGGSLNEGPLFPNPFFATGRPIIEPYWAEVPVAGEVQQVLLQCFERRCLTYTPGNPDGWQVEAGNVGQHYYDWRYVDAGDDPLQEAVRTRLGDEVLHFSLVDLDDDVVPTLLSIENVGDRADVSLPVVGPQEGFTPEDLTLPAERVQLRAPGLDVALEKYPVNGQLTSNRVVLPLEQNFTLGNCAVTPSRSDPCGTLTVISPDHHMVSGAIVHDVGQDQALGISLIEPVNLVLQTRDHPGTHIVYHFRNTTTAIFDEHEEPEYEEPQEDVPQLYSTATFQDHAGYPHWETSIVLDGDQAFYNADPSTAWRRMEAVFNTTRLIFGLIEPVSDPRWGLALNIKGMEAWTHGGPSATDGGDLIDELIHPNYYLINPVEGDELHYFFVGYNVTNLLGRASGIGSTTLFGGLGWFGSFGDRNSAFGEARTGQSLKTQWVVMAHELGHLLGATHGNGEIDGCAGGLLSHLCGMSLMPAGSAGAPSQREPYFSSANDERMTRVLDAVLD